VITRTSGRAVRTTGAGTTDACEDPSAAVVGDVIGGAALGTTALVESVAAVLGSGAVLGWTSAAPPSAVALARPIDATRPNIVDTPSPAATIRAPTAG
jgi:hypothetical protein